MEARVEHICFGDRTQTSCTHEQTCVGAAIALTNWARQTDSVINLFYLPRLYEIIIHRLRFGTHISRMDTKCEGRLLLSARLSSCQAEFTFEHILLHCISFTNAPNDFFCITLTSISEFLLKVGSRSIIDFIKESRFKCMFLPEFQ